MFGRNQSSKGESRASSDAATAGSDRAVVLWGGDTGVGVRVTPDIALTIMAVWGCCNVLGNACADPPWKVYERKSGTRSEIEDHPLGWLLNFRPSPEVGSFNYRHAAMVNLLRLGNHYAEIETTTTGRPVGLHLIESGRVRPRRTRAGSLEYEVTNERQSNTYLKPGQVFHVSGMTVDGVVGLSPITYARRAFEASIETERYAGRLFRNDARPSIVLSAPGKLKEETYGRLLRWWRKMTSGDEQHGVAILEQNMTATPIGIPPEDAQFLASRKFSVLDVCRLYSVPPHMVGELDKATFSNIEQQAIEFVRYSLSPWVRRFEQEADFKLLPERDHRRVFTRMNLDSLLRGDIAARFAAYQIGVNTGILSPDEVRAKEDMNPQPGGQGQVYARPLSQFPVKEGRSGLEYGLTRAADRLVRREVSAVRAATEKRGEQVGEWFKGWKSDHRRFAFEAVSESAHTAARASGARCSGAQVDAIVGRWADDYVASVGLMLDNASSPDHVIARCEERSAMHAGSIVRSLVDRLSVAFIGEEGDHGEGHETAAA